MNKTVMEAVHEQKFPFYYEGERIEKSWGTLNVAGSAHYNIYELITDEGRILHVDGDEEVEYEEEDSK